MSTIALFIPISRRKALFSTLTKMPMIGKSTLRLRIIKCPKTLRVLANSTPMKAVPQRSPTVRMRENSRDYSVRISSLKWMKVTRKISKTTQ